MKFIDDLKLTLTGRYQHLQVPFTAITESVSEPMACSEKLEYEVRLIWGYKGFCRAQDMEATRHLAIQLLKKQLYGELREELYLLQKDAFDCEWDAVNARMQNIMREYLS